MKDDLYWCTKNTSLPRSDVRYQINRLYTENHIDRIDGLYRELSRHYRIRSFNRKNLLTLVKEDFLVEKNGYIVPKSSDNSAILNYRPKNHILVLAIDRVIEKMLELYHSGRLSEATQTDNEVDSLIKSLGELIPFLKGKSNTEVKRVLSNVLDNYPDFCKKCMSDDNALILLSELEQLLVKNDQIRVIKLKIGGIPSSNNKIPLSRIFDQDLSNKLAVVGIITIQHLKSVDPEVLLAEYPSIVKHYGVLDQLIYDAADATRRMFLLLLSKREDHKPLEILKLRSEGLTLDAVGNLLGVTRERIRQIEKKAIQRFQLYWNLQKGKELRNLLFAQLSKLECVSRVELTRIFKDYTGAFIYTLEKISKQSEGHGCFVYIELECLNFTENDWYTIIENELNDLDEHLSETEFNRIVRVIKTDLEICGINLDLEIIKKVALQTFSPNGKIYVKGRINLVERYRLIIEKHYRNGIRVYDEDELKNFRQYYKKEFEDPSIDSKSDRSISARLCDASVQVGRGTYNLEYRVPVLPDELALEIKRYIDNGPDSIFTLNIFNHFSRKLRALNIDNRFMLHAMLKRRFGDVLFFRRNYIAKTEDSSTMMESLDRYLRDREGFFTIDEIDKVYPSSKQIFVISYLNSNPEYIPAFNRKWINGSQIEITEEETLDLKKAIDRLLRNNPIISTESVLGETRLKLSAFYERNQIKYQFFLFGILSYLFADEYEFDRPFIATKGTLITKAKDRLIDYIGERDEVQISELQEYTSDNDLGLNSMQNFISSINDQYLRSESNLLTSISALEIGDETPKMVDSILDRILGELVGVNARRIKYSLLPQIGKPWSQYLLASFIEHYSDLFNIVYTTSFYNNSEFIIVRRNAEIEDYETFKMRTQ